MKVQLSVLDRLLVLNALPAEDNIVTLRLIRKVKEQLGFTDDELKELEFKTVENKTTWKNTVEAKEFDLSEKTIEMIADALKALSDKKKLTDAHLDLYDKVVQDRV